MTSRIPLNTFAIAFGFAGLAEVWADAGTVWGWPHQIGDAFWLWAGLVWLTLVVLHTLRGARSAERFVDQLRHPAQGPIAALIPVLGMLMGAVLHRYAAPAGTALVISSVAIATVFAGWIVGRWLRGDVVVTAVHGGYLLPTVASGLLASYASAAVGVTALAWAAFAVGIFFWVVIFTLQLARFASLIELPAPLVPTMAILVAPPAVAGLSLMALTHSTSGPAIDVLAGLTVVMFFVQTALLPVYRRTPFSIGFWSFTFPFAAVAAFVTMYFSQTSAAALIAALSTAVVTVTVLTITALSLRDAVASPGTEEVELLLADDAVAQAS